MGARLQSDEDLSDTSLGLQFVIFGISREFQFGRSLAPGAAAQRPWRRRFFIAKPLANLVSTRQKNTLLDVAYCRKGFERGRSYQAPHLS